MRQLPYLFFLVLLVSFLNFSSSNEDIKPKDKKLIPIKITHYGEDYSGEEIYTYDNTNRLIKISDNYGDSTVMKYDTEGKLVKTTEYEESYIWRYYIYDYNSLNQVIKISIYYEDDYKWGWLDFKYDGKGNVVERTAYGYDNLINTFCTFSYDSNDNMISVEFYLANSSGIISNTPYEEWTYIYDNKNHIYKFANLPFFKETNINNVVQRNLTEHDEGDTYYQRYNITYVYNEDNYPIECIEHIGDERYEIEYKEI